MDIDKKVALTKGKELYIVTHKIDPVIKIEMKQKKSGSNVFSGELICMVLNPLSAR